MKKILAFIFCTQILYSCSNKSDSSQNLSYVEFSNIEKNKKEGKYYFYYGDVPFTGFIVDLYNSNQTVSRLSMVKNGQLTGVTSKHGGDKTIGQITTQNGMQYRLPTIEEEVRIDKELAYYDGSEQLKVQRMGYLKQNESGRYEFIRDGDCIYYNKDGSVRRTDQYKNDKLVE